MNEAVVHTTPPASDTAGPLTLRDVIIALAQNANELDDTPRVSMMGSDSVPVYNIDVEDDGTIVFHGRL